MKKKIMISVGVLIGLVVAIGIFLAILNTMTVGQVEQEWATTRVKKMPYLGTTRTLEILPLFEEAKARDNLELEHGVSYLVKTDRQNILLDVGMTPARFAHNMQTLGVSAKDFDAVFLTHIHPDHMGGTDAWWNNTLLAGDPPLDLRGKRVYVPLAVNKGDLNPIVVTQPAKIADGVATIGAIAFPELFPLSLKSSRNAEQSLAVNVQGKGIVLILGCGHPSVERIVARAQALFDAPIVGIVGGLHYEGMTRAQAQPHIGFVANLKPQLVAISPHDSSVEAIQAFQDALANAYQPVQVGTSISIQKELP